MFICLCLCFDPKISKNRNTFGSLKSSYSFIIGIAFKATTNRFWNFFIVFVSVMFLVKVHKCWCFPITPTATFTWLVRERCKFVACRKRMPAIMYARHWVLPVQQRYEPFYKSLPSMISHRQSSKLDRQIKHCQSEAWQCYHAVPSGIPHHVFGGTKMECHCKPINVWSLYRVDSKLIVRIAMFHLICACTCQFI